MPDEKKAPLTIRSIQAQNIMRLVSARLTPDNATVVTLAGENGEGKTSLLTAIQWLLRGRRALPSDPIRHGAQSAKGALTLGRAGEELPEFSIERTLGAGREEFVLRGADGKTMRTPQAILDALLSSRTADPSEFTRLEDVKQAEVLRKLAGIDTSKVDATYAEGVELRRSEKRDLEALLAQFEVMAPAPDGTPDAEVSVAELSADLEDRLALEAALREARALTKTAEETEAEAYRDHEAAKLKLREAEAAVELARARADQAALTAKASEGATANCRRHEEVAKLACAGAPPEPVRAKIATAEETNRNVRAKHTRAAAEKVIATARARLAKIEQALTANREGREKMLREAKYPLPGLGINEEGVVTYNGSRFDQCSSGEQVRVSCAMACAMNPGIGVVLMRDGAYLSAKSREIVAQTAQEYGCQAWIEVVDPNTPGAVIIADGEILEREPAPGELAEELNELDTRAEAEAEDRARDEQAARNDSEGDR